MTNIFKNAYFDKTYRTIDGHKGIVIEILDDCVCLAFEKLGCHYYHKDGNIFGANSLNDMSIVSEWHEEINEDEYENKIKSLIDSCIYWEAYEDEPELYAKAFKELLDFAPNDKRTIDYCADMIKSRKTIFNEVNKAITSFICHKPKEISEEELDKLAEEMYPYEYTTSLNASEEADYINDLREAFKKGYRKALKQ